MSICSVVNCTSNKTDNIHFFELPEQCNVRRQWLRVCDRSSVAFCCQSVRICSLHFNREDYSDRSLHKLKPDVVPTRRIPMSNHRRPTVSDKSQKREVRRYALDSQRRNSVRKNYFEKLENHLNDLLLDSEIYNRTSDSFTSDLEFQDSSDEKLIRDLNVLARKLSAQVARLNHCCKYWHKVARARGQKISKLKLEKRRLWNELKQFENVGQNSQF